MYIYIYIYQYAQNKVVVVCLYYVATVKNINYEI